MAEPGKADETTPILPYAQISSGGEAATEDGTKRVEANYSSIEADKDKEEAKLVEDAQIQEAIPLATFAEGFDDDFIAFLRAPQAQATTAGVSIEEEKAERAIAAAEEGESRRLAEEQGEESGSQPPSDGCGAVVFRFLRGILATTVFYIIEPFWWYAYVMDQREHFTLFEDAFFVSSAVCGLLGHGAFLFLCVLTVISWDSWEDDASVSPGLLFYLLVWRLLGNFVSTLPAFRWAACEAMWRFDDSSDARLRNNLSLWYLSVAALVYLKCDDNVWAFILLWSLFMYPLTIYLERNILLSDHRDRLCPPPLGDKFIHFRTFELYVVVPLVYAAFIFSAYYIV